LSYASNVAHVQGESGTFVVPAHSPYDRQMLREHIEILAGRVAELTLNVQGTRWTITRGIAFDSRCTTCTQFLSRLSCSRGPDAPATCIDCVMQPARQRRTEGHES
jgi:hypothetical protein